MLTTQQLITLGRRTALISFALGTTIFAIYYLSSAFILLFVGFAFILLAALVNVGVLVFLVARAIKDRINRNKLLSTSGFMLLNIPVMLLYCWMTIILLDTMRITFTNATQTTLTDINIQGCGGGHIDEMEPGESETVWVDITGDCSIRINYMVNGQHKEESVAGYVTGSMGQQLTHNIGGLNKERF